MADNRYPTVPELDYGVPAEHLRRVAQAINGLLDGQGNNHFTITLDANSLTTQVLYVPVNINTAVQLTPASATAATAVGAGVVWYDVTSGVITIHHDSTADTDRKFAVLVNG